jgi:hypothetical protein
MSAAPSTLRGMAPETYAVTYLITPAFADDRPALENFLRVAIADRAAAEGYEAMPETFGLTVTGRPRINGVPMLTEDEIAAGMTGDELVARATVQCRPRG